MSFRRGAALSTSSTLGFADTADVGPTAGTGFYRRWPDDLAALQDAGATDVRLTIDWARLQPKPDTFDDDWAERFEQMIAAATAIDLRVWATLHDGSIPKWLDNEGGLADDEAVTRWWPRWVERTAERFGDLVGGWVPFATVPAGMPEQPWRDTWGILGGGDAPVVASVDPDHTAAGGFSGLTTALGLALPISWDRADDLDRGDLERAGVRWGDVVRDAADAADAPIVISGFSPTHDDPETASLVVERLVETLDDAISDGVVVELCFLDPAISSPESPSGLLDADRAPTPAGLAFLA
jgi:beta-glucosidase